MSRLIAAAATAMIGFALAAGAAQAELPVL
jgi:hypothetical protein